MIDLINVASRFLKYESTCSSVSRTLYTEMQRGR